MEAALYLKKAGLKLTPVHTRMVEIFLSAQHALPPKWDRESIWRHRPHHIGAEPWSLFEEKAWSIASPTSKAIQNMACAETNAWKNTTITHHAHVHFLRYDHCHLTYCVENVEIPAIEIPRKIYFVTGKILPSQVNANVASKHHWCQADLYPGTGERSRSTGTLCWIWVWCGLLRLIENNMVHLDNYTHIPAACNGSFVLN